MYNLALSYSYKYTVIRSRSCFEESYTDASRASCNKHRFVLTDEKYVLCESITKHVLK